MALYHTCDWGDCDEPIVGFRLDDDRDGRSKPGGYGWLPVCQRHYDDEPDQLRKASTPPEESLSSAGVFDREREVCH